MPSWPTTGLDPDRVAVDVGEPQLSAGVGRRRASPATRILPTASTR
jgi:hypothetical protein